MSTTMNKPPLSPWLKGGALALLIGMIGLSTLNSKRPPDSPATSVVKDEDEDARLPCTRDTLPDNGVCVPVPAMLKSR